MERISTPSKTKEIIEKNNFYFKKNFGQNFLIDSNIIDKIVESAKISKDDFVLEIGPGIGSLTQILAQKSKKVLAVEIDKNLISILEQTLFEYQNIEIINDDILKIDIEKIIKEKNENLPIKVVANLPYYITTPIIMNLLEKKLNIKSITIMVQKEVAQRLQAKSGTKDYGAVSIAVQYYSDANINMFIPSSCFMPRPKVDSAVITLDILKKPRIKVKDEKLFFEVVKCAFGQRRKTFLNSLINIGKFGISKEIYIEIFKKFNIDEKIRGEMLTIEQMGFISDCIYDIFKDGI